MNCMAFTYYVTLMAKCTYAGCCCVLIQVSQDGFILRLICVFLGCDLPIQLVLSSDYDDYDRLEDRFIMYRFTSRTTKYVTFYA